MDIFDLAGSLVEQYEGFSRSFANIRADDIKAQIDAEYDSKRFWPEPVIQINPEYKLGATVAELVQQGALHPGCGEIFKGWRLRYHQQMAATFGAEGSDFIVTTGTGSGKSLCFFIPIISAALRDRRAGARKTRAIIVYPMNALANSQQEELAKYFAGVDDDLKVSYARFTGQESQEDRRRIADNPPDILLTNFVMLELLLTRQDEIDRKVLENCEGLSTLVLDELHTYRGRQGADVAMLVRRLRRRLAPGGLQCIGTSATMSSDDRPEIAVAAVASKLFDCKIHASHVITERLERRTNPKRHADSVRGELAAAIAQPINEHASNAELAEHPVAIWIETVLGVEAGKKDGVPDGTWGRARPRSLNEAAGLLSGASGVLETTCKDYLERFLLVLGRSEILRAGAGSDKAFLGVRLHQFISGAGQVYMTIQPEGRRKVVFDGQKFLPDETGDKLLYQLRFCPHCGQEHLPVTRTTAGGVERLAERDIDEMSDAPSDDGSEAGFFMPARADLEFDGQVTDYPETWQETTRAGVLRLKSGYSQYAHRHMRVDATGVLVSEGGTEGWFQPGRFRFCPACGEATLSRGTDRSRLAGLTAEGRGSASTIIVSAILNWMSRPNSGVDRYNRKILGFIDNRQDAALQSGHFNDFVFVSLMRAATLMALEEAGEAGLEDDQIGRELQRCLGFDSKHLDLRVEWLSNPELQGAALSTAERTLRDVLTHRFWVDQLKIWRVTNPNLARLGLMTVEYKGLDEIASNNSRFDDAHPILAGAAPAVRKAAMTALLDHMRINLAIKTGSLEAGNVQGLRERSQGLLRAPWNLSEENSRQSAALFLKAPGRAIAARDEVLRVRSGPTSALGRTLRASKIWGQRLSVEEYDHILKDLLKALENEIIERSDAFAGEINPNWAIYPSAFVFKLGGGEAAIGRGNTYFTDLYRTLARMLRERNPALFGLEAREHTAQVEQTTREVREARFRFRKADQDRLRDVPKFTAKLQELADTATFLPVMFCSPTMELGVDIADLDTVFLRNVPPTPANYAQRGGRAGRNGQAALIVTYCAAQSPHDQYYFKNQDGIVAGRVRAPTIELDNQDLVESHLQAIWLAETAEELSPKIANVVDLANDKSSLTPRIMTAVTSIDAQRRAVSIAKNILHGEFDDRAKDLPWLGNIDAYAERVMREAPKRFNGAFDRWRALLVSAEQQLKDARAAFDRYAATDQERRMAKRLTAQAQEQIQLLLAGEDSQSSDYFTYRYLATEGFLPGYNFPRLPLTAFVNSSSRGSRSRAPIQRSRFVGISEFGPGSLIYHEGRAHRVNRVIIRAGSQEANGGLATQAFVICPECGCSHALPKPDFCRNCGTTLADASEIRDGFRIESVETMPTDRITANDEDRQRRGFEIRTVFEWPVRDAGRLDVRRSQLTENGELFADLTFGPATLIRRFNVGLRKRAKDEGLGYQINPASGYWVAKPDDDDDADAVKDPSKIPPQTIVPFVEDRKNALLLRFHGDRLPVETAATLQHALLRGIEMTFQLEEGEVLGEPLPSRDERNALLIYESTEGGAGVLARLVSEPGALRKVIDAAIGICHFDLDHFKAHDRAPDALQDEGDPGCVAGCYRCLLSYYNQTDHDLIDRRSPQFHDLLSRLSRVEFVEATASNSPAGDVGFDAALQAHGLPPVDEKPLNLDGHQIPYIWREHKFAVISPDQEIAIGQALVDRGITYLIALTGAETSDETLQGIADALKETAL